MTEQRKIIRNADNEYAVPWSGRVNEVNGIGAEEIAGIIPTRHELLLLVRYWRRVQLDYGLFTFNSGQYAGRFYQEVLFASDRINRIAELLGDYEVDQAIAEAEVEFSKELESEE